MISDTNRMALDVMSDDYLTDSGRQVESLEAVEAMRDEATSVASRVGCSVAEVVAWCDGVLASEVQS